MPRTKVNRREIVRAVRKPRPRKLKAGSPAPDVIEFFGTISDKEASEMKSVIQEEFGQVVDED